MNEAETYKELVGLTKDKAALIENAPRVASLLGCKSVKIRAKALWLLGETGLERPELVRESLPEIASFLDSPEPLLRERALGALKAMGADIARNE